MFTNSARAAFHRLAARAHNRLTAVQAAEQVALDSDNPKHVERAEEAIATATQAAQDRTDEAWSVSYDEEFSKAGDAERSAADEAATQSADGLHRNAAKWHRAAAKAARAA